MNYQAMYKEKLVSADEAVKVVKSNDTVMYGWFVTLAFDLDAALAKRKDELRDVYVMLGTAMHVPEIVKADPEGEHFVFNDYSFGVVSRKLNEKGQAYFIPEAYHEIPDYYRKIRPVDVVFLPVTPMDEHGFFNMSSTCSVNPAALQSAKHVVLEVNRALPFTYGVDNNVHISQADYVVESSTNPPLFEIPKVNANEIDRIIASYLVEEITDGACLQLGIGGMPNCVGEMLADSDIKDLGIHTEMLVDSVVDLYEAGRVTNMAKNIDKGKSVYTFAMGSKKLYDYIDRNPACCAYPADYTNCPGVIASIDNFVSICGCLNVDILGQVSSESIGFKQVSGTGGQLDFHFASFHSKGGKGFLCMPSTNMNRKTGKKMSRIVPAFLPGTVVTVPSSLTNYVVTEYGIVNLKGKSTWERAEDLISIAHPDFRDDLINECKKANIWRPSNKIAI